MTEFAVDRDAMTGPRTMSIDGSVRSAYTGKDVADYNIPWPRYGNRDFPYFD